MENRALRVAYVSLHTSPIDSPGTGDAGGMNVVELNQALSLGRLGHTVDLITRRSDRTTAASATISDNVTLRLLDAGRPEPMAKSAQESVIEEFQHQLSLLEPYDVIVAQHWMSGMAALPVARIWGVPHVQSYHSIAAPDDADLSEGEPAESPGRQDGERMLARESDAVIAVSKAEAQTVIQRLGADPSRVHIVLPGVDHEVFRPATERARPAYLAYAARLQPLKGPDLAIELLAAIQAEQRPQLRIAGTTSQDFADYRRDLDRLVARLALEPWVEFVGSFDRAGLADFFGQATLTLVPSYSETFGLVALESAACGTPVIASASGGLLESVSDGRSGILMQQRNPREWADATIGLLSDESAYAELAQAAYEFAAQFTWERSAAEVGAILVELVGS